MEQTFFSFLVEQNDMFFMTRGNEKKYVCILSIF